MRSRSRLGRAIGGCAAAAVAMLSCTEGPYAIANPNDPLMALDMRLTGGADTVRTVGQTVAFQLVTDPVVTGYPVSWASTTPPVLSSTGDGNYVVLSLPAAPLSVTVSATLAGTRQASAVVVVMPP